MISRRRTFTGIYKHSLSVFVEDFKASRRPPQFDKRLYHLLRTADPYEGRRLISRLKSTLSALLDAMIIAVDGFVKIRDLGSHEAFTFVVELLFATRVRDKARHEDEKGIHDLLDLQCYERPEAFYSYAALRTRRSSVRKEREGERAQRELRTPNFDRDVELSAQ